MVALDLDGVSAEELHSWTGHIRYTPRYGARGNTADVWALELAPKSSLGAGINSIRGTERERFAYNGGEVVIYDCGDIPDARWATWMGPWNMAHGMFYAPQWEADDVLQVLSRVQWTDTPEGLTASPGRRFNLQLMQYFLPVAGVGTLQVEPKSMTSTPVPGWRGLSTQAGEIWRMSSSEGPKYESLMLATESAVVTLDPWAVPRKGRQGQAPQARSAQEEGDALGVAADFLSRVKSARWGA
ncbi:hypothetical protein [Planobispora takensis]|uniref:Uncharacterized protein n=1 Tax=Planobispora takensis TaxID=1367882 RepID=A0A8J3SRV7_9ACTN|nr:hypothetical protein [Planobispora takensis]GIH98415.1 hypothetical protein Pta02_04240 [Planobispora takensis]